MNCLIDKESGRQEAWSKLSMSITEGERGGFCGQIL